MMRMLAIAALLAAGLNARAGAEDLAGRFASFDETSSLRVDHGPLAGFLARYRKDGPDGVARLDYAAVTAEDRAALGAYLDALEGTDPRRLARPAAFAFFVNLYNAQTIEVILENYPVRSIRDIRPGLVELVGPWRKKYMTVNGEKLSLDDVEHGILRAIWKDPRIHYVVNCASIGCPDLPATPLEPEGLEARLEEAARTYVNHPRGAKVEGGRLVVSRIYEWYEEDFGGTQAGVIAHLRAYAGPALAAALEGRTRIDSYDYDWALNEAE